MTERAIDFVRAEDRTGKEYEFDLSASALRRITRRLRELSKSEDDQTAVAIESVFITVWECRVDKTITDEEEFFSRFSSKQLRGIVQQLQDEHQPESDPTEPGTAENSATPATVG